METRVKVFENEEFGRVRTTTIGEEPYFVGKDVAEILGYAKPRNAIIMHVDDEDKKDAPIQGDLGGVQQMTVINESGLYSLILSSKLPSAKKFKRWVTSEVLPTLRRTGSYTIPQKPDSYMIEDPAERARRWAEEYEEKKALETQLEEQKPLVEYAEQIQASKDVIDMKSMAKLASKRGIKIGRNKLFAFLRAQEVLDWENIPYASYMNRDWFEVVASGYTCLNGEIKINKTTLVKPKGQLGIVNLLKKYYTTT